MRQRDGGEQRELLGFELAELRDVLIQETVPGFRLRKRQAVGEMSVQHDSTCR